LELKKITSFTINHLLLEPGIYVSRVDYYGDTAITTFDLRMTSPNREPVMNTAEMHTIEHLGATFLRNDPDFGDKIVYFGPMGCRTGFYMTIWGEWEASYVAEKFTEALKLVLTSDSVPAENEIQCGNYIRHSLELDKKYAKDVLDKGLSDKYLK
jgi:S-ribosylhomocysteine lyase